MSVEIGQIKQLMNGVSQDAFWLNDWLVQPALNQLQHKTSAQIVSLEPKVMDLLLLLARNAGQVISADDIVSEIWKDQVVGDNSIYQNIAQLRKALQDKASQPSYIATVPKKGYRLIAAITPFQMPEDETPIATETAPSNVVPIHELKTDADRHLDTHAAIDDNAVTPQVTPQVEIEPQTPSHKSRWWGLALCIVLLLLSTVIWRQQLHDVPAADADSVLQKKSYRAIAVLPFANMSDAAQSDYFADGITDELIIELSKLSGLQVVARTSVFAFKDVNQDVRDIGRALNVDALVQGSVRRFENKAKVNVQLVDASDGFQIWSDSYEFELKDIFQLESDIAHQIAIKLEANLSSPIRSDLDTKNIAAYELYLLGRHHFQFRTQNSLQKAIGFYQQAIEQDPEYALAYSGLIDSYLLLSEYGDLDLTLALDKASGLLEKARLFGEHTAEVQASFGLYHYYRREYAQAEQSLRNALALNPGYSIVHMWLGLTLMNQGQVQDALNAFQQAQALDPLHITIAINLALAEAEVGQTKQGIQRLLNLQSYYPSSVRLFQALSLLASYVGDRKYALKWAQQARQLEHSILGWLTLANAQMLTEDFQGVYQSLLQAQKIGQDNQRLTHYWALYYLSLGDWQAFDVFTDHLLQKKLPLKQAPDPSVRLALVWRGVALAHQQRYQDAAYYLEQGLQIDAPTVLVSQDFDRYFFASLIQCYRAMGLEQQADALFNRSIATIFQLEQQQMGGIWFLMTKARVLAAAGKVKQSQATLRQAQKQGFAYDKLLMLDPVFN